jgi:hypothetical protein
MAWYLVKHKDNFVFLPARSQFLRIEFTIQDQLSMSSWSPLPSRAHVHVFMSSLHEVHEVQVGSVCYTYETSEQFLTKFGI